MPATAFSPGSVTTIFAPQDGDASLGVSLATADGVTATVETAAETTIFLNGKSASVAPVEGVLRQLGAAATVRLHTALPIGCGFGVSGASTLAAVLAANEVEGFDHDRDALVGMAHQAEVEADTGRGDVFVQNRGGLVWDRGNGIRHRECHGRVEYRSFGRIATADLLGDADAMAKVRDAGQEALQSIDPERSLRSLLNVSWDFATRAGLPTDRVRRAVERVRAAGGAATMAMIGETIIATGSRGALDADTRIAASGAELQS